MNETYLIDTHSHVDMLEGISIEDAIKNAKENGVKKIIVPCAYPKDVDKIFELVNMTSFTDCLEFTHRKLKTGMMN